MNEYVVHAKVKNNLILARIQERSQTLTAFCAEHGLNVSNVCAFINLKRPALSKRAKDKGWAPTALALASALDVPVEALFTEEQAAVSLRCNEAFIEMTRQQALSVADPRKMLEDRDLVRALFEHAHLNPQQVQVLRMRMKDDLTLDEIGRKLQLTRERIRQIEAGALRKMRTAAMRLGVTYDDACCYTTP